MALALEQEHSVACFYFHLILKIEFYVLVPFLKLFIIFVFHSIFTMLHHHSRSPIFIHSAALVAAQPTSCRYARMWNVKSQHECNHKKCWGRIWIWYCLEDIKMAKMRVAHKFSSFFILEYYFVMEFGIRATRFSLLFYFISNLHIVKTCDFHISSWCFNIFSLFYEIFMHILISFLIFPLLLLTI